MYVTLLSYRLVGARSLRQGCDYGARSLMMRPRLSLMWRSLILFVCGGGRNGDRLDLACSRPRWRRLRFRHRARWVRWRSLFTVRVLWRRIEWIRVSRLPVGRRV